MGTNEETRKKPLEDTSSEPMQTCASTYAARINALERVRVHWCSCVGNSLLCFFTVCARICVCVPVPRSRDQDSRSPILFVCLYPGECLLVVLL